MFNGLGFFRDSSGYEYEGLFENNKPFYLATHLKITMSTNNFDESTMAFSVQVKCLNDDLKLFTGIISHIHFDHIDKFQSEKVVSRKWTHHTDKSWNKMQSRRQYQIRRRNEHRIVCDFRPLSIFFHQFRFISLYSFSGFSIIPISLYYASSSDRTRIETSNLSDDDKTLKKGISRVWF